MKIPESTLKTIAARALQLCIEQISEGRDIEGNPYSYSSRPFAMPAGSQNISKGALKNLEKSKEVNFIKNEKSGKLWLQIQGGYKFLREIGGRSPEGDFLRWTGGMLSALTAQPNGDTSIKLGFVNQRESDKAYYLNFAGAGKSHSMWKFLGLNRENLQLLINDFTGSLIDSDEFINELTNQFLKK